MGDENDAEAVANFSVDHRRYSYKPEFTTYFLLIADALVINRRGKRKFGDSMSTETDGIIAKLAIWVAILCSPDFGEKG